MKKLLIGFGILIVVFFTSLTVFNYNCLNLPSTLYHYMTLSEMPVDIQNTTFPLADTVRNMDNMPYSIGLNGQPNNTTDAGATLGRVLFYDEDLSINHTISCADCHKQEFAFTDTATKSFGWQGPLGPRTFRNSMGLMHARFHKAITMFWDMRATSIENQVTQPIRDGVEMGMSLIPNGKAWDTITGRIRAKSFYPPLFQAAFGATTVDSQRIALALAQFVRSMNSYGSKYRTGVNIAGGPPESTPFPNFTAQENLGKALFMDTRRGNCQACHTRNIFVGQGGQNNGVDGNIGPGGKYVFKAWSLRNSYAAKDSGMGGYRNLGRLTPYPGTNWQRDTGKIKANIGRMAVPSLINIALTGPYMHDGRYKTLDQVINFYSDSVKNNDYNTLSLFLRRIDPRAPGAPNNVTNQLIIDTSPVRIIHYTLTEKAALKAFLLTLTDTTITKDVKFSNPFCIVSTTARTTSSQNLLPVLSLEASPNPAKIGSNVTIQTIAGQDFTGTLKIVSNSSKVVYNAVKKFSMGSNTLTINTKYLKAGVYIIKIEKSGQMVFFRELIVN